MSILPEENTAVTLQEFPLSAIYVADNYRSTMSREGLEALADSIKAGGLIQPVTVRPLDEPIKGCTHALVAGFRRHAASELAGLPTILATVRRMTAQTAEAIRLAENIVRENPHPADEAVAVGKLAAENMTTDEICAYLGKSAYWVTQRRAISGLLAEWLTDLRQDKLTLSAAEELSRWPLDVQQRCLSVRHPKQVTSDWSITNFVRRESQVLGSAPWPLDDATVFPAAGACTHCPKRSSCNVLLFSDMADDNKDHCLDSVCWQTKLTNQVERVFNEQKELAGDATVVRLSSRWSDAPAGSLKSDKYQETKAKKGSVVGVYVDGSKAAKVVRVTLTQEAVKAVASGKTELSQGEKNRETRQKRLLKEAGKRVLADRSYHALQGGTDEAKQGRVQVLAAVVAESLMQGRNIDLLTLAELSRTWGWEPVGKKGPDTKGVPYREWVVKQVLKYAPTEALLTQLLLFSVTHRGLSNEWTDYQQTAASLVGTPQVREGLTEAAQELFEREYDPRTLRPRKESAAGGGTTPELDAEDDDLAHAEAEQEEVTAQAA